MAMRLDGNKLLYHFFKKSWMEEDSGFYEEEH